LHNAATKTTVTPGCGVEDTRFDVKTIKGQHPAAQPDAGKALVYFIEDDSENADSRPTTRAGLDGSWVGATHGNSYSCFSVAPGEHHLCASWQKGQFKAVTHFSAEAGNVYYFRVRNYARDYVPHTLPQSIDLAPLDSDESLLLTSTFPLRTFRLKK
jgi:hypothetical protein